MKKFSMVVLLFSIPLFLGCEKILKTEIQNYDEVFTYTFQTAGPHQERQYLTRATLLQRLNIPSEADIQEVEIESISFRVKVNPANEADGAKVHGFVGYVLSSGGPDNPKTLFDRNVSFVGSEVFEGFTPIGFLVSQGIDMLKSQITNWILKFDNVDAIGIWIDVEPTANKYMAIDFYLQIRASIKYQHCVSTGKLLGSEGIECEDLIVN